MRVFQVAQFPDKHRSEKLFKIREHFPSVCEAFQESNLFPSSQQTLHFKKEMKYREIKQAENGQSRRHI